MDKTVAMLWPEGRTKALTFSYDDGVTQDRRLIGLMRANGLRGTFNLNSGFLGWTDDIVRSNRVVDHSHIPHDEVPELYAGMEIAVHTVTHPDLCRLSDAEVLLEVLKDREALEQLAGKPVHGMAYPFGTTDARVREILKKCGIRYSRGVEVTNSFTLPVDPLNWSCSCHHADLAPLIPQFFAEGEELRLLTVWGHSYEFDEHDSWPEITAQMQALGGHDDVWYPTNGEMFDYIAAFDQLDCTLDGRCVFNPTATTLWMRHEGKTYRLPAGETVIFSQETGKQEHPFRIWKG